MISIQEQAYGTAKAFFAHLNLNGCKITVEKQLSISFKALTQLSKHLSLNRVYPKRLDHFKFTSFLTFEVLELTKEQLLFKSYIANNVPEAANVCVSRLISLVNVDTNSATSIDDGDKAYICSMLDHEVNDTPEAGIGANGLASMFSMLAKYGDKKPDLSAI